VVAGYNFPVNGNIFVGPFVSIDFYRQRIDHRFGGAIFIGSTSNWVLDAARNSDLRRDPALRSMPSAAFPSSIRT